MKLDLKALVLTAGILWGAAVFLAGLSNLIWNSYASAYLQFVASIYPGYDASGSFGDLIVGTIYALIDGGVAGLLFGLLYNLFLGKAATSQTS